MSIVLPRSLKELLWYKMFTLCLRLRWVFGAVLGSLVSSFISMLIRIVGSWFLGIFFSSFLPGVFFFLVVFGLLRYNLLVPYIVSANRNGVSRSRSTLLWWSMVWVKVWGYYRKLLVVMWWCPVVGEEILIPLWIGCFLVEKVYCLILTYQMRNKNFTSQKVISSLNEVDVGFDAWKNWLSRVNFWGVVWG